MSEARPQRLLMIEQGGRGGVADYTGALVRALAARGWRIDLATADDHLYEPVEGVTSTASSTTCARQPRTGDALRRLRAQTGVNGLLFLLALPRLVLLARRNDIVHTQGWEIPQLGLPALAVLRLAGAAVVQTAHGTFERTTRARACARRCAGSRRA